MIPAIALLLVAACNVAPSISTPTPTPTPSPADVALQAGDRMLDVQSLHFIIHISGDLVYLDDPPTMALKRAEGDVERPDRMRAIVKLSSFGIVSELGIVGLGDDQYITNPINQQWERIPPGQGWTFDPAALFDPEEGIEAILRGSDWRFGPVEEQEGQDLRVLQGQVPGERLGALSAGLIRSGDVEIEIWVDREDAYVHRIHMVELDSDPDEPTEWQIELSAFDEPVEIEPPPVE